MLSVGGCGSIADLSGARIADANPVDWWHGLEGGAIAEQRPDPPGAQDPFPNLSIVPARPVPTPAAQRLALTAQLTAERDGARRDGARDPLAATPAPAALKTNRATDLTSTSPANASPASTLPANTLPASTPPPMATLDAASAPPAPAGPREPLPARVPVPTRARPPARGVLPSGPVPDLPAAPPPTPMLSGMPAATFVPATRRPTPSLMVAFAPNDDALPPGTQLAVQALADRRFGGAILVFSGGDAMPSAAGQQGPALALALRRAQVLGRAVAAAGVPPAQTRTRAEASGRESGIRLVE